jgi:hypothetical protein
MIIYCIQYMQLICLEISRIDRTLCSNKLVPEAYFKGRLHSRFLVAFLFARWHRSAYGRVIGPN